MKRRFLILSMPLIFSGMLYATDGGKITSSIGVMNGTAKEYVIHPKTKDQISRLDWKIKNVPMFILGYEHRFDNWNFSITGKKNIKNNFKSGYMEDFDYFTTPDEEEPIQYGSNLSLVQAQNLAGSIGRVEQDPDGTYSVYYDPKDKDRGSLSNFSKNKNYVKNIFGIDLNVKYFLAETEIFKIAPLAGINYNEFNFYALDGAQENYIPGVGKLILPAGGKRGIYYKQRFYTPYLGFETSFMPNKNWEILFDLKGSVLGYAKAIDRHIQRGAFKTEEKYKNMKYLSSSLNIKYNLNNSFSFKLGVQGDRYFKNKKSKVKQTMEDGEVEFFKDLSGIENKNFTYSFGFEYIF